VWGIRMRAVVVDPEMGVRTLVCTVLEQAGCDVVLARDSNEAQRAGLSLFHRLVTAVDLEQRSGGINLAHVLRGSRPDIRIVYLTEGDVAITSCPPDDGGLILKKPFTIPQLRRAVTSVFGRTHEAARGT
jgi:DNA-binding response OmpR family regulator